MAAGGRCRAAILGLLLALAAPAQGQDADPKRALVEQKLRLLESLLASPRATRIDDGDNAEAKALLSAARGLARDARGAFAANDIDRSGRAADEAMRAASTAVARGAPAAAPNPDEQRARSVEMLRQIRSYRGAIVAALAEQGEDADSALARLDRLIAECEELSRSGRHADASRLLGEAYRAAIALVAKLRGAQTVVYRLTFDTPAQEYDYEASRHRSYEMLVELALSERGGSRAAIAGELSAGRALRDRAATEAGAGSHASAIRTMEQATGHLVRALQTLGVPVSP